MAAPRTVSLGETPALKTVLSILAVIALAQAQEISGAVRYVSLDSPSPNPPYTNWSTAAHSIQLAVDASVHGDTVIVSNGVYRTGGRTAIGTRTNRLVITTNWVTVQSLNGPAATAIEGYQSPGNITGTSAVRCVYMNLGALIGFTLTNGAASGSFGGGGIFFDVRGPINVVASNCVFVNNAGGYYGGGGAYCSTTDLNGTGSLINCTLTGNTAGTFGGGGGALSCRLSSCILSNNTTTGGGGGAAGGNLTNCALIANSAFQGGGASGSGLYNCVLFRNSATDKGGGAYSINKSSAWMVNCTVASNTAAAYGGIYASFSGAPQNSIIYYNTPANYFPAANPWTNCCTAPLPANGVCNITNEPLLLNLAAGDFRLQPNSPCINAGNNTVTPAGVDFDGNPRIAAGNADMGAFEVQTPGSVLPYWWLQTYGFSLGGAADYLDDDGDLMNNWQEWRAGTDPTNAASVLKLLFPEPQGTSVRLTWQSVTGITYSLDRSPGLAGEPTALLLASNLVGQAGTTSYADTNATSLGSYFYRVRVQ